MRRYALLGIAFLAAILFVSCRGNQSPPIVLLTVDTLRADHLATYGYRRTTDPNLQRLARDAVVFDRAFTPRGKTTPAYASMMTGLYPYRHGVRRLGVELAPENRTLAETLQAHGYTTAGFVSSTVMIARLSSMDQGFRTWDDRMPRRERNRDNYERPAEATSDAVLAWLSSAPRRSLLFVHLIDPHGPYLAPPSASARFSSSGPSHRLMSREVPGHQRIEGRETLADYVDAYDTEVLYADQQLGRIVAALRERGLYDRALVIFTADHGEALGDHDVYFRHGYALYDDCLRVPLLIKPPYGRGPAVAPRWSGAVSLVDIFPTVLDYSGAEVSGAGVDGDVDGVSLRSIVEGRGGDSQRLVYSSRKRSRGSNYGIHHADGSLVAQDCGRDDGDAENPWPCSIAYFDADADPLQQNPQAETPEGMGWETALQDRIRTLRSHSLSFRPRVLYDVGDKAFVRDFMADHNGNADLLPEDAEALRSLGYLDPLQTPPGSQP